MQKNAKHAALLATTTSVADEKILNPLQLATLRAERIAKEKLQQHAQAAAAVSRTFILILHFLL